MTDQPDVPTADAVPLANRREAIQLQTGQLVLAMARTKRYARLSLSDLDAVVVRPLLSNRVAFFHDKGTTAVSAIAIWASVTPDVSARIATECDAGTVPVRLAPDEWVGGTEHWLLDILAPDRRAGSAGFQAFAQMVRGQNFRIHPVVLNALDDDLVEKLRDSVRALQDMREQPDSALL